MKFLKTFSIFLCIAVLLGFTVTSYAASNSKSFTYDFKHQLSVKGNFKATKSTVDFSIFTTTNESDEDYFKIKQFEYRLIGYNPYVQTVKISCKANEWGNCSISTKKNQKYTYEFWKSTAVGKVIGSGTMTY